MAVPKFDALFNPMLQSIRKLGGSASIAELNEEITNSLHLTDEDIAEPHGERGTELQYRLAWARTYFKAFGLLDNTARGVWVLTEKANTLIPLIRAKSHASFVTRHGEKGASSQRRDAP